MGYNLADKAMLVRVNVTMWTARKYDKNISDKIAADNGAKAGIGNFNKTLLAKEALAKIIAAQNAARVYHYANSLPWCDDGYRILPAMNYTTYIDGMRSYRDAFESAVREFIFNYPALVQQAKTYLNGAFNPADYPSSSKLESRFSFDFGVMPLPEKTDFRVNMSDSEIAKIQAHIESRVNGAVEGAMTDLWQRIYNAVSHMSDRLKAYTVDPNGKVSNPFRDSLVENLRELVELLPRLNVTGDAKLADMADQLATLLCPYDPDSLREDETLRESVARDADALLANMAGYVS